jgi:hypothetical protein
MTHHRDFMSPGTFLTSTTQRTQQQPPHHHFQLPPNEHKQASTRLTITNNSRSRRRRQTEDDAGQQGLEMSPRYVFFCLFLFFFCLLLSFKGLHYTTTTHDGPHHCTGRVYKTTFTTTPPSPAATDSQCHITSQPPTISIPHRLPRHHQWLETRLEPLAANESSKGSSRDTTRAQVCFLNNSRARDASDASRALGKFVFSFYTFFKNTTNVFSSSYAYRTIMNGSTTNETRSDVSRSPQLEVQHKTDTTLATS